MHSACLRSVCRNEKAGEITYISIFQDCMETGEWQRDAQENFAYPFSLFMNRQIQGFFQTGRRQGSQGYC